MGGTEDTGGNKVMVKCGRKGRDGRKRGSIVSVHHCDHAMSVCDSHSP